MGLRSNFKRIERDYYRTIDPRAVKALAPFLTKGQTFIEPCAGDGILTDQIVALGLTCLAEYDLEPNNPRIIEKDGLTLSLDDVKDADMIISNPPWRRDLLHPMIDRFSSLKPTWLLFDGPWMFTKQAKPYLDAYCTDIVTVGRLKWIENTTMSSKDDVCWYRFDINKNYHTKFHGR